MPQFGLIGQSLAHSFSRDFFLDKFESLNLTDHDYLNFEINDLEELPPIVEAHPELMGFNVTIPFKEEMVTFLDRHTLEASAVGAVNCVKIVREGENVFWIGHNTDVYGFQTSLQNMPGIDRVKTALILGTGGAAKSVQWVLDRMKIKHKSVSRDPLARINYYNLKPQRVADVQLIINATPLGTWPDVDECPPIPYEVIGADHLCFDLVYNPEKSLFLAQAEAQGATIQNGLEMLVLQAEKSWEIWNS
ncbi:shikimate dehydrogenase [bacterium SCSIO 12741]|nr:shikimate dehydrogenase [bacterium SCSIO 12741]